MDNLLEYIRSLKQGDLVEYRGADTDIYCPYHVMQNLSEPFPGQTRRPLVDLTLEEVNTERGLRLICFTPGVPSYCAIDIRPVKVFHA